MKKCLAIVLLVVIALLVPIGVAWLAIFLALEIFPFGILIAAVVAAGDTLLLNYLRGVFKRHFELSIPKFFLCAYLPSVIGAAASWIYCIVMENSGRLLGPFAGLGEFLFAFSYSITVAAMLVMGLIGLAISTAVERRRTNT